MSDKVVKCSRANKTMCQAMETVLPLKSCKLELAQVHDFKANKKKKSRPILRLSKKDGNFAWLNYCPWCRGDWVTE